MMNFSCLVRIINFILSCISLFLSIGLIFSSVIFSSFRLVSFVRCISDILLSLIPISSSLIDSILGFISVILSLLFSIFFILIASRGSVIYGNLIFSNLIFSFVSSILSLIYVRLFSSCSSAVSF